jgi:hypothetical protein
VWSCPLTQADGTKSLIVWNTAGRSHYKPAAEYVRYKKFNGTYGGQNKTVPPGESIVIGVVPFMFESGT